MRIKMIAAAVLCMVLTSCGSVASSESKADSTSGTAESTSAAEVTEVPKEVTSSEETVPHEEKTDETEPTEELDIFEDPSPEYQNSLTKAFMEKVNELDYRIEFEKVSKNDIEGMARKVHSVWTVKGKNQYYRDTMYYDDGSERYEECVITEDGLYRRLEGEDSFTKEPGLNVSDFERIYTMNNATFDGLPSICKFVSAEELGDGTVREVLRTRGGSITYNYIYGADGILKSMETDNGLVTVISFEEGIDGEFLPNGLNDDNKESE